MQGVLYEEDSLFVFLLVTVAMGGWLAWMTGRALALTWRGPAKVAAAMLPLAFAVRFIHMALFGGTLIEPHYYVVDLVVLLVFGLLGYRRTRVAQMVTQYRWLYERDGFLNWRERREPVAPALETAAARADRG
ncbi:MAG: hypothetical protein BGP06_02565 [Rhizobiales bacterium 65-9]|nr:hypothetical protein [Hyphomicrobiales bacterium]OJY34414.1 MAG: hypothetical protein BGP06_02565 [Rhizobiales bacterium 65-9]